MAKDIGIIHETFRLHKSDKHQVEIKVYPLYQLPIKPESGLQDNLARFSQARTYQKQPALAMHREVTI